MTTPAPSPLARSRVELVSRDPATARTVIDIDPTEPLFAGHYRGFAILPGVCLVECVHRSARLAPPPGLTDLTLGAVESARFLGPVFADDRLTVELRWETDGDGWRCVAELGTERGTAARIRLHYPVAG